MFTFIRNQWYVAAEPAEIESGKVLARTVLKEPIVLFRTEGGQAVALEDRCPHRQTPLSLGTVVGETIRCGYHGAQFDSGGACVAVPGQDKTPRSARVKSYPIVEKHGWIWIWMGDAALADDQSSIPEGLYMGDHPGWDGYYDQFISFPCYYELINDNLFDITHAQFVHPETLGAGVMSEYARNATDGLADDDAEGMTYAFDERHFELRFRAHDCIAGPLFHRALGARYGRETWDEKLDWYLDVNWWAPSFFTFTPTFKPVGKAADEGITFVNMNAITPEDEGHTHYFFNTCQCQDPGNKEITKMYGEGINFAFSQDKRVISAQQQRLAGQDVFDVSPISFAGDTLQLRGRKINRTLASQEQADDSNQIDAPRRFGVLK